MTTTAKGSLNERQEKALALLPLLPALLSILASLILLRLVKKSNFKSPYRRILFAMTAVDILNEIRKALGVFLVPTQSRRIWAFGNATTCRFLGITTQLVMPSYMYYGFLSIYFLLHIRYNVSDRFFAKYIEPWIHVFSLGYAIITAILGATLNLIGESKFGNGCWINPNPSLGCGKQCVVLLQWIFGGIPFTATFLITLICNLLIVAHVWSFTTANKDQQQHASMLSNNNNNNSGDGGQQQQQQLQTQRIRMVTTQAMLYVFVYYITHVWTFSIRCMAMAGRNMKDEASIYWLLVLRSFFYPLMGLGNLLVYLRPRYQQLLTQHPELSNWDLIQSLLLLNNKNNHNHNKTPGGGGEEEEEETDVLSGQTREPEVEDGNSPSLEAIGQQQPQQQGSSSTTGSSDQLVG